MAVAIIAGRTARSAASFCHAGPARLADAWTGADNPSDPRRQTLHRAFVVTGLPNATETWQRVAGLLDRYTAAWLRMYRDACEATHVRGEQSPAVLDLRMTCVEDRHVALKALTDLLATATPRTVASAVDAVVALPARIAARTSTSCVPWYRHPTTRPRVSESWIRSGAPR